MTAAEIVLREYKEYLAPSFTNISQLGTEKFPLHTFSPKLIEELCEHAKTVLKTQPTVLLLTGSVMVVGDVHGNIFDVVRILKNGGLPISHKYLFLGDFVDRGDYSIDVMVLLFAMLVQFPQNCFLVRGNHELKCINSKYGFYESTYARYNDDGPFNNVNEVFNYLPLAAVVNQRYFCAHGGISQYLRHYSQLNKIIKPFDNMEETADYRIVSDVLWGDPVDGPNGMQLAKRGIGNQYTEQMVSDFLRRNKLEAIIRAHTPIDTGVARQYNNQLYTVFSSSDIEESLQCGVLFLTMTSPPNPFVMNPIRVVPIESAVFKQFKAPMISTGIKANSLLLTTTARDHHIVKPTTKRIRHVSTSLILNVWKSGRPQE